MPALTLESGATGRSTRLGAFVWAILVAATATAEDRPSLGDLVSRYGDPVVGSRRP